MVLVLPVTNLHKLSSYTQHSFFSSSSSDGHKSRISLTWIKSTAQHNRVPSGGSRAEAVSLPFPASGGCCIP